MPVIYLDVLIALNWFVDYLLLSATSRVLRNPVRRWRIVAGALLGGVCSCLIFLPRMPAVLSFGIKLAAASLIVLTAFPWIGFKGYLKQLLVFFVRSAAFAGIAAAVWFFAAPSGFVVANGVVYYDVPPLLLVGLTVFSYLCIRLYDRFVRKKAPQNREFTLALDCGGGEVRVRALYDTGLHLVEPFSGSPVAVVRYAAIAHVLPPGLKEALAHSEASGLSVGLGAAGSSALAVQSRLRLIPFQTVGGDGLLPAFQAKKAAICAPDGYCKEISGVYIAVCPVLGRGEYEALVGSDLGGLMAE